MIIARADAALASAKAFALAHGRACELFEEANAARCLALLARLDADAAGWSITPVELLFQGGRVGTDAGGWLFCVGLWVPVEHREEFLDWYRIEHLPILLECPTWDGCRFVEAPDERGCQFFALHQLADRAALDSPERARSRATPWFMKLKQQPWFDEAFTRTLYRRVDLQTRRVPR